MYREVPEYEMSMDSWYDWCFIKPYPLVERTRMYSTVEPLKRRGQWLYLSSNFVSLLTLCYVKIIMLESSVEKLWYKCF